MKKETLSLILYPLLTFLLSLPFWIFLSVHGLNEDTVVMVLGLLWCPGLAGLLCRLLFFRSLRGMGWAPGKGRYLLTGALLPLVYCLAVYLPLWLSGAARFVPACFTEHFDLLWYLFLLASMIIGALGEEIGWRGHFSPLLSERFGPIGGSLLTGIVWALWHFPLLIFTDYRSFENPSGGFLTPLWYALLLFSITLVAITFVYNRLRDVSGSLWPAVALHTVHNYLLMNFFATMTGETILSPWLAGETGAVMAVVSLLLALVVVRLRTASVDR